MIVIDNEAASKLAHVLEKVKAQSSHARCIFFNVKADKVLAENTAKQVLIHAAAYVNSAYTQIYLCDDGDIFIIAPTIPSKNGKDFIEHVAAQLDKPVSEHWVRFLELPLHLHVVLFEVSAKLDRLHEHETDKQALTIKQQAQNKRQAILENITFKHHENITQRRAKRNHPEIMIIEDDPFSRRLVENTLLKKYPLTGLAEATYALDTYTRIAPDVLFLDINLPDVTGHELLEKIIIIDPDAYVVMLSGNSDRHNITQAMSKGAKGFVAKPFSKEKLFHYIEHCPTITSIT